MVDEEMMLLIEDTVLEGLVLTASQFHGRVFVATIKDGVIGGEQMFMTKFSPTGSLEWRLISSISEHFRISERMVRFEGDVSKWEAMSRNQFFERVFISGVR